MPSCDGCTACCKMLKIRELNKPGNTWCPHCKIGAGCTIYDSRPESCRVYECIWLQTQAGAKPMPLELRPDRSHVVIGATNQGEDLVLYVSPDRPDAWKHGAFGRFVATMKARGVAMVLSCGDVTKAV